MRISTAAEILGRHWLAALCWLVFISVLPAACLWASVTPLSVYWMALLLAIAGLSVRAPGPPAEPGHRGWLIPALFLAAGFAYWGTSLTLVSVGMESDMLTGRSLRIRDLIWVASGSQQPPLFIYLYRSLLFLTGADLTAARALPAFFGTLSLPLLFLLLRRAGLPAFLAGVAPFILLLDPVATRLAREVRPYTCGIFFFLVYLLVLTEREGPSRARFLRLLIASYLLLISLGAQPLFVGSAAALAYGLVHQRGQGRAAWLPLGAFAAAALLFSPFQAFASITYPQYFSENGLRPFIAVWSGLIALSKKSGSAVGFIAYFIPLIPFALWLARRAGPERGVARILALLPLISIPMYAVLFGELLAYMQQDRYLVLLKVAVLVGLCASGVLLLGRRWGKGLVIALAVAGSLAAVQGAGRPVMGDPRWKAFFTYLDSAPQPDSLALMFSVAGPEVLEFSGFVGMDFYLSGAAKRKVKMESAWGEIGRRSQASAIHAALEFGTEPEEVLFYDINLKGSHRLDQFRLSHVVGAAVLEPEIPFPPLVMRVRNVGGLAATLERFLLELEAQEKTERMKFRIYLGLSALRSHQRRCAEARAYWDKAKAIAGEGDRLHDSIERERKILEACEAD